MAMEDVHFKMYVTWDKGNNNPPAIHSQQQSAVDALQDYKQPNMRTQFVCFPEERCADLVDYFTDIEE